MSFSLFRLIQEISVFRAILIMKEESSESSVTWETLFLYTVSDLQSHLVQKEPQRSARKVHAHVHTEQNNSV